MISHLIGFHEITVKKNVIREFVGNINKYTQKRTERETCVADKRGELNNKLREAIQ